MKTAIRALFTTITATAVLVALPAAAMAAGGVPNPHPEAPGKVQDKVDTVLNLMMWIGGAAVVGGLILAGIIMAVGHNSGRGGREGMERLSFVAGGAIIIGSCSVLAGWLL